tara:strand:- start:1757 stop:2995 length:1239 start_codon:yes stop_codon:yes gene_type:complete
MANSLVKTVETAFVDILASFDDECVISREVQKYSTGAQLMERANDTINRPMPYILNSQERVVGTDITFQDVTQRQVPSTIDQAPSVAFKLNALELRDALQKNSLGQSAKKRIASDINTKVRDLISLSGSLVVPITGAMGGYLDVALAEALMIEQGIIGEKKLGLNTRDYTLMADNLAARTLDNAKSLSAYERSQLGLVAGFDALKMDSGKRIAAAAAGGSITVATNGAQVQYVPTATADNRYQSVTFSSTTSMVPGDAFTIAGIEAVHHINKESTGLLKTFRVVSVTSGTVAVISPAIVGANQGSPTDSELAYKNVEVASTSATAAVVWLNANASNANVFWNYDSVELLPGKYAVPSDEGAKIMQGTTEQGIELVMTQSFNTRKFETEFTLDAYYGLVNLNPEMNGIIIGGQ